MKTMVIACEMLRPEIEFILAELDLPFEVYWIEPALHLTPNKLHTRLQELFDSLVDIERVIMPFGECGGALKDLQTKAFEIIVPQVDDCLTLMLGSQSIREQIISEEATFFLTLGWIKQEKNIFAEYEYALNKYGEEAAEMIYEQMYGNYKRVALIDTGVGNVDELLSYKDGIEKLLKMKQFMISGTLDYLRALFLGPWPESRFTVVAPFSKTSGEVI
ncbi:MAG: DUF1638 domain-containing protein [Coriobacteriales bacterium]|nr:DUF1638 domain-containing protein [Coriobacteriales bacterium]